MNGNNLVEIACWHETRPGGLDVVKVLRAEDGRLEVYVRDSWEVSFLKVTDIRTVRRCIARTKRTVQGDRSMKMETGSRKALPGSATKSE
jgi:hypothetical protein